MATPPPTEDPPLVPAYEPKEREKLTCLLFYEGELAKLNDRGLIAQHAYLTILAETIERREAIERTAIYREAMCRALRLKITVPTAAVHYADKARAADPSRRDAWELSVELYRKIKESEKAIALSEEAVARFADFPVKPDMIRAEIATAAEVEGILTQARDALQSNDDERAVSLTDQILRDQPGQFDATVVQAFAKQRMNDLTGAISLYRSLSRVDPTNSVWKKWVADLERRFAASPVREPLSKTTAAKPAGFDELPTSPTVKAEPTVAWSDVAGEFLQDHWQKLILCLAVLLIVVSSNVGAYQILGERLWKPEGKCLLALVYTGMFALFGAGLVRWGAERAGRIMLLTTLIVVPANFMLAGQMKLLTVPSTSRLAVLAVDAVALFFLIRLVATSLRLPRGSGFLSVSLFGLSLFNAGASHASPWPWPLQFAVFLAPAFVYLASVVWVTTGFQAGSFDDRRETTYFALALLTFAFLTGLVRTGIFAIELAPTLYAVPVMLMAVAGVRTSRSMPLFDPDPQRIAWMKFAAIVVSGLGFTFALARPPEPSTLFSGNTLAAALVGLAIYAVLLSKERVPAYLYFAFGALFVANFGVYFFVHDLTHAFAEAVKTVVGYRRDQKLPAPFKAINGLVLSPFLAGLSLFFAKKWSDKNLARHCHYIGVPFSIASCVYSGFEPKAAIICLSGYAILYGIAVRVFAAPWITYLSTAALAGAVYFGTTLAPGVTAAQQGLIAALLGLAYWSVGAGLSWRGIAAEYLRPLGHAALGMSALAVFAAISSIFQPGAVTLSAGLALLVVAGIAVLVNLEEPDSLLGYYAVVSGNVGLVLLSLWGGAYSGHGLTPAEFASACALIGFCGSLLGNRLAYRSEGESIGERLGVFPVPLIRAAAVQVGLTLVSIAIHAARPESVAGRIDFATLAFAFGFAGLTLALLTRPYPYLAVTNLGLACGLGLWVCLFQVLTGAAVAKFAAYGAVVSVYSLFLIAIEELSQVYSRRHGLMESERARVLWRPELKPFVLALPWFELGTVALALGLCVVGLENGMAVIYTLTASALTMLWSTRLRAVPIRVDAANFLAVCAAFSATDRIRPGNPWLFAWLAATAVVAATTFLAAWRFCERRSALTLYPKPLLRAVNLLTWLVFALAIAGRIDVLQAFPICAGVLAYNVVPILFLAAIRRQSRYTYRAIASGVAAVYMVVLSVGIPRPENAYVLGLVAVILSLSLSAIGFAVRALSSDDDHETLYALPVFASSLLLALVGTWIAYKSPVAMGLAAFSYLLFVKALPARQWLYATVGSLACALYHGVLVHWPESRLAVAALGIGFGLWVFALAARRGEPFLTSLFKLPQDGYAYPLFNSALIAAATAAWFRTSATWDGRTPLSDSAGLTLGLAVFAVLMIKPYPLKLWAHAAAALATASTGFASYPRIGDDPWWLTLGMGLSIAWVLISRGLHRYRDTLSRIAGVPDLEYSTVPRDWARGLFALTAALITALVGILLLATIFESTGAPSLGRIRAWSSMEIALGLAAVYLGLSWRRGDRAAVVMGLTWAPAMAVWWLVAPISPMVAGWGVPPLTFLPLATAVMAVSVVAAGARFATPTGWVGPFWKRMPDADFLARLDAFSLQAGLGLAALAAMFTRGTVGNATVGTLLLTTTAAGLPALVRKWVPAAYAAALFWCAASAYAVLDGTRKLNVVGNENIVVFMALGMLVAVGVLLGVGGSLRRRDEPLSEGDVLRLPAVSVAAALEQVAAFAWLFSGMSIGISAFLLIRPDTSAAAVAVGVLFGLTLAAIGFIARWRDDRLIYPAHATLLGSYLYYRWAFPLPAATDAVVLTLFGYLDLGLAEVMERVGLGRYARHTRYASLGMPLVPIVLSILGLWGTGGVRLDDVHLFILFSAATFYGVASYGMKWRRLGYAAAVLYNAFLWFLWGRVGYTFADKPQFFLIPVGLSAILFAEDNREILGKDQVTAFRGVGLTLIYLSLAAPIWQSQSLGAWVTLLMLSLAGIFVGIGLRAQVFLWFGLVTFVLDVIYQLGRMGAESSLAKWGIMLVLGIGLVVFVAVNEKKSIVQKLKVFYDDARAWE